MITQDIVRTVLQATFQVPIDRVVPKQGNWWSPQDITNSGTWVAFLLTNGNPRVLPFDQQGTAPILNVGSQISTSYVLSDITLQIVGPDAELLAMSIQHWLNRSDIVALWDSHQAQLCGDALGRYEVSSFTQDGLNGVLAYNSRFSLQWANMFDQVQNQLLTSQVITGNLTIGA